MKTKTTVRAAFVLFFTLIFSELRSAHLFSISTDNSTGAITGKVIDASSKKPIEFAFLMASRERVPIAYCYSQEDGTFNLSSLLPGNYAITIEEINYRRTIMIDVPVVAQQRTLVGAINLQLGQQSQGSLDHKETIPQDNVSDIRPIDTSRYISRSASAPYGGIRGQIVDEKSLAPIPYAGIFVSKNEFSVVSGFSDSSGNYFIDGLMPGSYTVEYVSNSYLRRTLERVRIDSQEYSHLYIEMLYDTSAIWKSDYRTISDSGILIGNIFCKRHFRVQKLASASVTLLDSNGVATRTVMTDQNGHFSLKLSPGIYLVEVQDNHHKKVQHEVKICLGQTRTLTVEMKEHQ